MSRIVIALGGNALGSTPDEQLAAIRAAAPAVISMITADNEIILTHGNGPQVGAIQRAFDVASSQDPKVPVMPLAESTALSQGYIGYHLQQELAREITHRGWPWHVATVVTQVEVDPHDPAFEDPTKPIGAFIDEESARRYMAEDSHVTFVEDAGRGWRRVVASPRPRRIVERDSILNLLDAEFIVITCGGGGVPVIPDGEGLKGVDAVIDKDFCAGLLAEAVGADLLFILTAVPQVAIGWGTPNQKFLDQLSVDEAERYIEEGQFAPGSMLPKVRAAVDFVRGGGGRQAVICSLDEAPNAARGRGGTVIHP